MNYYVGFDTSLRGCALAVLSEKSTVFAGSLQLGDKPRGGERLAKIRTFLVKNLPLSSLVVSATIEGPSLKSVHREFDLGEVSGIVKQLVYELWHIEARPIPPTRLKLYASGHGHTEDLIHAVKQHWGHDAGTDDDQADAFALAHLARALATKPGRRRCEVQVVHDILHPDVKKRVIHKRSKDNI